MISFYCFFFFQEWLFFWGLKLKKVRHPGLLLKNPRKFNIKGLKVKKVHHPGLLLLNPRKISDHSTSAVHAYFQQNINHICKSTLSNTLIHCHLSVNFVAVVFKPLQHLFILKSCIPVTFAIINSQLFQVLRYTCLYMRAGNPIHVLRAVTVSDNSRV